MIRYLLVVTLVFTFSTTLFGQDENDGGTVVQKPTSVLQEGTQEASPSDIPVADIQEPAPGAQDSGAIAPQAEHATPDAAAIVPQPGPVTGGDCGCTGHVYGHAHVQPYHGCNHCCNYRYRRPICFQPVRVCPRFTLFRRCR